MLVVTRSTDETISIGNDITVTVRRIEGDKVRIGITAPSSVVILRGELEPRPDADGPALRIADEELSGQANRAAADIIAAIDAGEGPRDLVNLTVSTLAAYLRDPAATLTDAIAAAYSQPAEVVVLRWARR
jgi:carbon storage regulator